MSQEAVDAQASYADKISKLLRQAESTDSEAEAEAFTAKAQALMIKYAITEELLARAEGRHAQDVIVTERVIYTGIFHRALFNIGWSIVRANDCKGLITKRANDTALTVIGFKSDVTNVQLLDASLQIQASTAMQRWYRTQAGDGGQAQYASRMDKYKMRREFLFGFAQGLFTKLDRAKKIGIDVAIAEETTRTGDADGARKSTDLVLLSKKERVTDWMDNEYGSALRTVRRNYSSGGYAARVAGTQAGMNADVGNPRVGGSRGQIGR